MVLFVLNILIKIALSARDVIKDQEPKARKKPIRPESITYIFNMRLINHLLIVFRILFLSKNSVIFY